MDIIGKSTIHPILFYSGKIAGYIIWILFLLAISGYDILKGSSHIYLLYASYFTTLIALIIIILSSLSLGKSIRLGLPVENTNLKTRGIYKLSRNPMYVGFNFLTISGMIYFLNPIIILLGLYSIVIYHLIILGEERFLSKKFGEEFSKYMMKTRRYL
jgi:protein-S-isoprenylcysteine O-methyltransferase Ste14